MTPPDLLVSIVLIDNYGQFVTCVKNLISLLVAHLRISFHQFFNVKLFPLKFTYFISKHHRNIINKKQIFINIKI